MRYRPTYTVDIEDWEGKIEWHCKVRVTTWGRPAVLRGVPMIDRHPEEPAEYEVVSVTCDETKEEHPDPEAFTAANDEEIWEDIHRQRQDELEDYDV